MTGCFQEKETKSLHTAEGEKERWGRDKTKLGLREKYKNRKYKYTKSKYQKHNNAQISSMHAVEGEEK